MGAVESQDGAPPVRRVAGRQPVGHGQQATAARGHVEGAVVEPLLHGALVDVVGRCRADQVAKPGNRPHSSPNAAALVEVASGDRRSVDPVAVVPPGRVLADRHRGDVGAEREQHRPRVEQTTAQGLDRLVVGRRVDRQSHGDAGLPRSFRGYLAEQVAGLDQIRQQSHRHPGSLELCRIGRPLTRRRVLRPHPLIARGAVAGGCR